MFNVYIVEIKTSKAKARIGINLLECQAEKRERTGLSRISLDRAFITIVKVGSKEDKKYNKDLKE